MQKRIEAQCPRHVTDDDPSVSLPDLRHTFCRMSPARQRPSSDAKTEAIEETNECTDNKAIPEQSHVGRPLPRLPAGPQIASTHTLACPGGNPWDGMARPRRPIGSTPSVGRRKAAHSNKPWATVGRFALLGGFSIAALHRELYGIGEEGNEQDKHRAGFPPAALGEPEEMCGPVDKMSAEIDNRLMVGKQNCLCRWPGR